MQIEGGRGAILFREECPSHFVYLGGWFGKYVVFRQFLVVCLGGMNLFSGRKTVGAYRIRPEVREVFAASLGESMCFRHETPFDWVVMYLFSVRKTVGAYRIRPEVREESAASSGDAAVGLRGSPT